MTEKEYKDLNKYAITLIHTMSHLLADDVVNDVLLSVMEAGEALDFEQLKGKIYSYVKEQKHNVRTIHTLVKYDEEETTKYCKGCKEDKPVAAFSIVTRNKTGVKELFHHCKECQAKTMREYYKTPEWKKQRMDYTIQKALKQEGKTGNPKINPLAFLSLKKYGNYMERLVKNSEASKLPDTAEGSVGQNFNTNLDAA